MIGLRYLRIDRDLTQGNLSAFTGIPQSIVCLIEKGRWNPTPEQPEALSRLFGVSAEVLMTEVQPPAGKSEEAVAS